MAATKRVDLSLSGKAEILKQLELPGVTQVFLAKKFGISTSQVSLIVKAKEEIREQFALRYFRNNIFPKCRIIYSL